MQYSWSKNNKCHSCGKRINNPPALGCYEDRHMIYYCKTHDRYQHKAEPINGAPSNVMQLATGLCWMCHREMGKNMCIDHDHETHRFRGLLCKRCNTILGFMEAVGITPEMIQKYLEGKLDAILFRLPVRS